LEAAGFIPQNMFFRIVAADREAKTS